MSDKLQVLSPYDGSLIEELSMHGPSDVEQALAKAKSLFDNRDGWLPKHERIAILERAAKIMIQRREELTTIAAQEGGKPYVDSLVEVDRAINGLKIAVEELSNFGGVEIAMGLNKSSVNRRAHTVKEPIGVVASVSAFNHPLNLIVHQTIPALAVGAPVIVKPALTTPRSCIAFVNILKEAGLPAGWCEYLLTDNESSEKLVTDARINFFSFIGSAKVGWYLRSKLAAGTRCALEHGGAAPALVDKTANLDEIIDPLIKGGFYHSGQVCVSVQRIFAHEEIVDDLVQRMIPKVENLRVGDPLDKDIDCGPLILPREVDRVERWVDEAVNEGAQLLIGGKRINDYSFQPTLLLNPSASSKVSREEIFGPVVCIYPYSDYREAIRLANDLPYSFQASVFTNDYDTAIDASNRLSAAAVMINDHTAFRVDWMPFGGWDASGLGIGGIKYSMEDMSREKLLVFKSKYL